MKSKILLSMICTLLILSMTGCGAKSENTLGTGTPKNVDSVVKAASSDQPFLTFKDMAGQDVILPKKPERIVILATETLDLFYQIGGKAVGRASAPGTPVSDAEKEAQDVGAINQVSVEKIASLHPDLVIGQYYFNTGLKDTFSSSHVPFALMKITSYEDVKQVAKIYGQILGKESETDKALKETDSRVQSIVSRVPGQSPTFAQVTIMPMGVYIQKGGSTAVDIASRLKLKNVAEGMISGEMPDYVPFSLEKLVETNPDYLFMTVHGTEEFGRKKLKDDMESNPAWASLRAVKEKKIYFLPSDIEKTPGLNLDTSFENMAKLAYPDIFGN
ncbi:ABC transporter substrate-binding protein [Paenibacillus sp. GCM10027628]|uniref:ABC transporter substrate-binding protein n=1 Tax=Paenibacillus sp. GCM10027628 TaxID=3273413 RepID=UPI00363DBB38